MLRLACYCAYWSFSNQHFSISLFPGSRVIHGCLICTNCRERCLNVDPNIWKNKRWYLPHCKQTMHKRCISRGGGLLLSHHVVIHNHIWPNGLFLNHRQRTNSLLPKTDARARSSVGGRCTAVVGVPVRDHLALDTKSLTRTVWLATLASWSRRVGLCGRFKLWLQNSADLLEFPYRTLYDGTWLRCKLWFVRALTLSSRSFKSSN